jgi:hypothetical protein
MPGVSPAPIPTDIDTLTFGDAFAALVAGKKVTRQTWPLEPSGVRACLLLHNGAVHIRKPDASLHTLIVQDGDITATDWVIVREH